jgi:hypothetical protein
VSDVSQILAQAFAPAFEKSDSATTTHIAAA